MAWEIDAIVDLRLRVHGIRARFDPTFRGTRIAGGIFRHFGLSKQQDFGRTEGAGGPAGEVPVLGPLEPAGSGQSRHTSALFVGLLG